MQVSRGPLDRERSGRVYVVAGAVLVLLFVGYLALGMPGMDHSGDAMAGMEHSGAAGLKELSPAEFNARLTDEDVFVVNVHVPADDSISGTDATIAYDMVADSDRLPADRDIEILLYCGSGRMCRIAGRALVDAGYRNVSHLEGGLEAWRQADLALAGGPTVASLP